MKILHQNNIGFAVSDTGEITCSSVWELMSDTIDDWTGLEAAVKDWAGNIGEGWRVPTATSDDYTVDTNRVIIGIDCTAKSRWIYNVSFKGRSRDITARMIDYSESTNDKDEKTKTATWSVDADSLDGFLPAIGDVLTWAGDFYYCDSISNKKVGILEGRYEVTITAIDLSTIMLGNPSFSRNAKYESVKSATWKVSNDNYEDFVADHDINSDASSWAGDGYYVSSIKAEPKGKLGYDVTVDAKHVAVQCLDINKQDTYNGFDNGGSALNTTTYTGKWQVHKDNMDDFENLAGESAESWAEEGYIVKQVSRSQISDMEYEYTLNAYNPDQVGIPANYGQLDNRSNLSAREDVMPGTREFTLTAEMAGYVREKPAKDSTLLKVTDQDVSQILKPIKTSVMYHNMSSADQANAWLPATSCPFLWTSTNPLPVSLVDKPLQCTTLEITQYSQGDPSATLSQLTARRDKRMLMVYNGTMSGLFGSWRRTSHNVEKILDNKGLPWWKETMTVIAAPGNYAWNPTYWNVQG